MKLCVVCGQQQGVTYGSKISRGFNRRFEKLLWRVSSD